MLNVNYILAVLKIKHAVMESNSGFIVEVTGHVWPMRPHTEYKQIQKYDTNLYLLYSTGQESNFLSDFFYEYKMILDLKQLESMHPCVS